MNVPKISQSLMKAFYNYKEKKFCGKLFYEQYVAKTIDSIPTESMLLGIFFEYTATGQLPRTGITPVPSYNSKGQLTEAYKRATESAEFFKKIIDKYNIKILSTGEILENEIANGITDIIAMWDGRKCIIDLKYSGLLENKWDEMGWELENLIFKDKILIQPVHYKWLYRAIYNEDIDFYFFVFDSKDSANAKIIKINVDEDKIAANSIAVNQTRKKLIDEIENGFIAYPDLNKCKNCPINYRCDKKVELPVINEIYY